ncbi:PhnD/SsuA/transferrin family substrate-binding protein [Sagittula sp. SSi028]|uniref:PhnD/SsuA/transferrin family substrate-binding protein n=1 Tax=Sagittula sp. SSi028 TaxID=3400636 RepID=UPI003AF86F15
MYWRPENAHLWRAFWQHVRGHLPDLPALTAPQDIAGPWIDHWLRPDLALSATCSLPLRNELRDRVTYVGTLSHGTTSLPGHYQSCLIRHPAVAHPRRLAVNEFISHSGWIAAQDHPLSASADSILETGSHAASLSAVAEGRADMAMIDLTTWRILCQTTPETRRVVITGHSNPSPAHAIITAKGRDPAPLRTALIAATAAFDPPNPDLMGGRPSFDVLPLDAYLRLPILPAKMLSQRQPVEKSG